MKNPAVSICRIMPAAGIIAVFLVAEQASAQKVESTAAIREAEKGESAPIVLSPFQVDASRDTGFVAASSVAGGRLAGELKDTPAAYSVLTREFIDAVGLTSLTEASKWMVNTGTSVQNGTEEITSNSPVNITFRGVGASGQQRNFFRLAINYDAYNIERYDMGRGPNAILFGNGGIGGVATAITKVANASKAAQSLQVSYGSWNNFRGTADVNAPLNDKFAVRANVLYQDREGWKGDWEMERKKAATLTATWNITRGTQARIEGEIGRSVRNNPLFGFNDSFTGWDGQTVLVGPTATLPSNPNGRGIALLGSLTTPYFVYAPGLDSGVINLGGFARTFPGGATAATAIGGLPFVGPTLTANGLPTLPKDAVIGLPASRFDVAVKNSKFRVPTADYFGGTNVPTLLQPYDSFTGFLTHRLGDLFLEVAGNYGTETRTSNYIAANAFYNTFIDINQTLPSGAANSRFLEPYNEMTYRQFIVATQNRNVRGSAAYLLKGTRWGDYSFNLMAALDESRQVTNYYWYVVKRAADRRLWSTQDQLRYRYYWSETYRPALLESAVTYNGVSYPVGKVRDLTDTSLGARTETSAKYLQAAAKARWFEGRVHLLGALRHDWYGSRLKNGLAQGDFPTDWNGDDYFFKPAAPADWLKLTYTPKDANGNATGPAIPATARPRDASQRRLIQYANDRFQDDYSPPDVSVGKTTFTAGSVAYLRPWLSGFFNYATSFNPNSTRLKVDGAPFGPQTAAGIDYGLRATIGTRLSIVLSTYRGVLSDEAFDTTASLGGAINQVLNANAVGDLSSGGRNIRGLINVPTQFFDARDRRSSGYELELIANPAPGLRVLLNGAVARMYAVNPYRFFVAYWNQNVATMRQIMTDAGTLISPGGTASVNPAVPADQAPDATSAVSGWTFVQTTLANVVSGSQKASRLVSPTANCFVDYELRGGRMRGLRVGLGANYRGREVIGYRGADTIVNPANPATAVDDPTLNAYSTVTAKPYTTGTLMLGYTFRARRATQVNLGLKVDNLLNYDRPRYYNTTQRPRSGDLTNPSRVTVPNQFFYLTPRNYTLSVTLRH